MKSTVFYTVDNYNLNFFNLVLINFPNYFLFIKLYLCFTEHLVIVCIKYKIQYSKIVILNIYMSINLEKFDALNNIYYLTQLSYFIMLFLNIPHFLFHINLVC